MIVPGVSTSVVPSHIVTLGAGPELVVVTGMVVASVVVVTKGVVGTVTGILAEIKINFISMIKRSNNNFQILSNAVLQFDFKFTVLLDVASRKRRFTSSRRI